MTLSFKWKKGTAQKMLQEETWGFKLSVGKEANVPQLVLMGKVANIAFHISVKVCSVKNWRNTSSLLKGVKALKAENRS